MAWPLEKRRSALAEIAETAEAQFSATVPSIRLSPIVDAPSWAELTHAWTDKPRRSGRGIDAQKSRFRLRRWPASG